MRCVGSSPKKRWAAATAPTQSGQSPEGGVTRPRVGGSTRGLCRGQTLSAQGYGAALKVEKEIELTGVQEGFGTISERCASLCLGSREEPRDFSQKSFVRG